MNSFDYSLTSKPDKCAAETLLSLMVNTWKGSTNYADWGHTQHSKTLLGADEAGKNEQTIGV